jgi:hypothetical protein
MNHGIDLELVSDLKRREDAHFVDKHPKSLALGERGRTTMPLGVPTVVDGLPLRSPSAVRPLHHPEWPPWGLERRGLYRYPDPAFDEPGFI